ncbi:MAG TPA: hypothetical protein VK979_00305 [Guyparkeria sp.]|nr:hypothetical protein [Guyparkeria sp.]
MQIKNLTNSPYQLVDKDGKTVMLPARGTVDIEPHPMHVNQYRQIGYFEITDSASPKEANPRDVLRAEYKELTGESADKRWSESRLRTEIEALLEA